MRKTLNNKVYNTETAKLCGEYWYRYGSEGFNYKAEGLYLKKTGEFFLHRLHGGGWEKIIPMTYEDAREWAGESLTADEYKDIFGEIEENDVGWTPVHVYVKNNLVDEMEKEKRVKGLSLKVIVNAALDKYFDK